MRKKEPDELEKKKPKLQKKGKKLSVPSSLRKGTNLTRKKRPKKGLCRGLD